MTSGSYNRKLRRKLVYYSMFSWSLFKEIYYFDLTDYTMPLVTIRGQNNVKNMMLSLWQKI